MREILQGPANVSPELDLSGFDRGSAPLRQPMRVPHECPPFDVVMARSFSSPSVTGQFALSNSPRHPACDSSSPLFAKGEQHYSQLQHMM